MSEPSAPTPRRAPIFSYLIAGLTLIVWLETVVDMLSPGGSDAAGNAMEEGFITLAAILTWIGVSAVVLISLVRGEMSAGGRAVGVMALAFSCWSSFLALDLLYRRADAPLAWPQLGFWLPPLVALIFAFRALVPRLARTPEIPFLVALCLVIAATSTGVFVADARRTARREAEIAAAEAWEKKFDAYGDQTPLADWMALLDGFGLGNGPSQVLGKMRESPRRQSDVEALLNSDSIEWALLPEIKTEATGKVCAAARAALARAAKRLAEVAPNEKPFSEIAGDVEKAARFMRWLATWNCLADAEARDYLKAIALYRPETKVPDFGEPWDKQMAELAKPEFLQNILEREPASFALLSDHSHLMAWLSFAYYDQEAEAIEGARRLPHRTDNMVEMLGKADPRVDGDWLLAKIPKLDLEATPALCKATLRHIDDGLAQAYHPKPENPTPFADLMRSQFGSTIRVVAWLAAHGCKMETERADAIAIVSLYQPSPERTDMLAALQAGR